MAWGAFTFNRDGRVRLAGVLRALLIAQLVVSICMVIFCYNTSEKVMALLKDIHKVTVLLLYGLVLCQAYCMKVHYTSGLRLVTWLLRCPHWPRVTKLSLVWLASGTLVSLNGILVYVACNETLKALMKELALSLRIGMSQYLTEPAWKRLLDTMQVELGCCGAEKPSDWHEIPWINMDFLNEDSDLVMKLAGADGKLVPPVSPYSCCAPRVLAACRHDPLQQAGVGADVGAWLGAASLWARGCVEATRAPLSRALLALHCFNMLVLLFQILIVLLTQLLRTSARDAALRGDGGGAGRGYLCGRQGARSHMIVDQLASSEAAERGSSVGGRLTAVPVCACAAPPPRAAHAHAHAHAGGRPRARRRRVARRAAAVRTHTSYPYLS